MGAAHYLREMMVAHFDGVDAPICRHQQSLLYGKRSLPVSSMVQDNNLFSPVPEPKQIENNSEGK
jgi:hypothetical protein